MEVKVKERLSFLFEAFQLSSACLRVGIFILAWFKEAMLLYFSEGRAGRQGVFGGGGGVACEWMDLGSRVRDALS